MSHKQRNQELYERMKAGNLQARDLLIDVNVPLVIFLADEFIERHPEFDGWRRGDLVGEGSLALVEAVDVLSKREQFGDDDVTAFVRSAIKRSFSRFRDNDSLVGPRRETVKKARKKDLSGERPCLVGTGLCDHVHDGNHTKECIRRSTVNQVYRDELPVESLADDHDVTPTRELRDSLEVCCETDTDRQIVELRSQGLVDDAIAQRLDLSPIMVYRLRKKIEARFDAHSLTLSA